MIPSKHSLHVVCYHNSSHLQFLLLLWPKHRLTNVCTSQPHVGRLLQLQQHIHRREISTCPLECSHCRNIDVRLCCEILLRHRCAFLVLQLGPCSCQCLCNIFRHLFRSDWSVSPVDFGQALSFLVAAGLLHCQHCVEISGVWAYICSAKLLFCANDVATSCCSIQSALSLDGRLSV